MNDKNNIKVVAIEEEMQSAYLDYAMSVIVARALPDVRDGLKPVHRRIIFAMNEAGNQYSKPFRKSARVVGEVMGKYHPHGDAAIYETMVRLAQWFSMRIPLVEGQGNFGSMDGDMAAAARYTEARLSKISESLVTDIDYDTVNFVPNYDNSLKEPSVNDPTSVTRAISFPFSFWQDTSPIKGRAANINTFFILNNFPPMNESKNAKHIFYYFLIY